MGGGGGEVDQMRRARRFVGTRLAGPAQARLNTKKLSSLRRAFAMSLYYEAAAILANTEKVGGSLKSRIYTKKDLKSTPGQIFALIAEASKWSVVLKDVIEKCGLLAEERKVWWHWAPLLRAVRLQSIM